MSSATTTTTATEKVFILLSGGVDSSTALAMAKQDFPTAQFEAISINYGQRHAKEMECAQAIADHFSVPFTIIDAKGFMEGMLVDKGDNNETVPDVSYDDLPKGISPTYITFRNGLMLSIVAAHAQAWVMKQQKAFEEQARIDYGPLIDEPSNHCYRLLQEDKELVNAYIYVGIHADDGANWAYPDCTQEFVGPMAAAIYVGTYNRVRVRSPFTFMPKSMLVAIGASMGVPYGKTWSCYKGGDVHCGTCPTCRSRKDAFTQLQKGGMKISDPTKYAS